MITPIRSNPDEGLIRTLLDDWTRATREGRDDEVLAAHAADVMIYDVLPPLRYASAREYRASWDDWQPDAQGPMHFELDELGVRAGDKTFSDTVRATFCLGKSGGQWRVVHQHLCKPFGR